MASFWPFEMAPPSQPSELLRMLVTVVHLVQSFELRFCKKKLPTQQSHGNSRFLTRIRNQSEKSTSVWTFPFLKNGFCQVFFFVSCCLHRNAGIGQIINKASLPNKCLKARLLHRTWKTGVRTCFLTGRAGARAAPSHPSLNPPFVPEGGGH